MTKTEKEIVEKIFNEYANLTIKEWIAKGIKAGRKQFAEEIITDLRNWNCQNNPKIRTTINTLIMRIGEKLQKEVDKNGR